MKAEQLCQLYISVTNFIYTNKKKKTKNKVAYLPCFAETQQTLTNPVSKLGEHLAAFNLSQKRKKKKKTDYSMVISSSGNNIFYDCVEGKVNKNKTLHTNSDCLAI